MAKKKSKKPKALTEGERDPSRSVRAEVVKILLEAMPKAVEVSVQSGSIMSGEKTTTYRFWYE